MCLLPSVPLADLFPVAILKSLVESRIIPRGEAGVKLLAECAHADAAAIVHFQSGTNRPRQPFSRILQRIRNNPHLRDQIACRPQLLRRMLVAEMLYDAERNLRDLRIAGVIDATPAEVTAWETPPPGLTPAEQHQRRIEANRRWRANRKRLPRVLQTTKQATDEPPPAA